MTAHSSIGASSMHRWSNCPGSVRQSRGIASKSSVYAEEGSDAHAYAAMCLTRKSRATKPEDVGQTFTFDGRTFAVDEEMVDAVQVYVDTINSLRTDGDTMLVEHKFDLSVVHPGCFGTADCVIWQPATETLIVNDLKYGAGIPVSVVDNPQLQYYGLGALIQSGFPAKRVRLQIIQPRCDHPDGPVRSWDIDAIDLMDFRFDLIEYAKATEAEDAPLNPGEWCRFCPGAALCPALIQKKQEMARLEFAPSLSYDPAQLKLALDSREPLKAWLKALDEFAYAEAEAGRTPPGYKLVAKKANRKWRDEPDLIETLTDIGVKADVIYAPRKAKSPAQLEKLIDKKIIESHWVQESSGHVLVPADDKRPAVKLSAKEEFAQVMAKA